MGKFTSLNLFAALAWAFLVEAALPSCPNTSQAEFDYVVVGAGAGGGPLAARLAENGFSVLVVEAGQNVDNVNTTIPLYFGRAVDDPKLALNYTFDEYPSGFRFQNNDAWYPRGQGLGGSTTHNALINIIANTQQDFDGLATTFNDSSWSRSNMQNYFKKIERNLYLSPSSSPDHGFDGWLKTNVNPSPDVINPKFLDQQIADVVTALATSDVAVPDLNIPAGDSAAGVNGPSFTTDENYTRASVHSRLLDVQNVQASRLHISLNTLATKVLMCKDRNGRPKAYGVTIAPGASLPIANSFHGKTNLRLTNVIVRREVIVSAGVFQSPQLLMLSGIGDTRQLRAHGIDTVVNLPGVGTNLQDHDEVCVVWKMNSNYSIFEGCTFGSDPSKDACLNWWENIGHTNLYVFGPTFDAITTKSSPDLPAPDVLTYYAPAFFRGFFRGFPQELAENHNALSATILKAHPSSKGTVRLTGSHPQDKLNIQKMHFQSPEGPRDVADLRDAIKRARSFVENSIIAPHLQSEFFPGSQVQSDEEIDTFVYENIFGHHACCTNSIGADDDVNAVLDGDFKVRGVANLRVVDASAWPKVPGFFVTTPTYMISEKAADVILAAAGKGTRG